MKRRALVSAGRSASRYQARPAISLSSGRSKGQPWPQTRHGMPGDGSACHEADDDSGSELVRPAFFTDQDVPAQSPLVRGWIVPVGQFRDNPALACDGSTGQGGVTEAA